MAFNYTSLQTPIITADTVEKNTVGRGIGILLPFRKISGGIFPISRVTNDQLKVNITNFIKTKKGERLYHPEYEELASKIKKSITSDFSFWLPFVSILDIAVSFSFENQINVKMSVRLLPSRANSTIVIFIDSSSNINVEIT
jgi:hypothetical protein